MNKDSHSSTSTSTSTSTSFKRNRDESDKVILRDNERNQESKHSKRKTNQTSQTNKAIAACTGAIAVSLLMTPFDVIKTRLQTQPPVSNPKLFIPDPHLQSSNSSSNSNSSSSTFSSSPSSSSSSSGSSSRSTNNINSSTSSLRSQSATTTTSTSTSHPATCCQQTFFTTNSHSSSLICRYDPRGIPIMVPENSVGRLTLPNLSVNQPQQSTPNPNSNRFLPSISSSNSSSSSDSKIKIRAEEKDCAFSNKKEATKALKSFNEKANENRLKGLWDGVIKVGKGEGVRGLWRGLSPTLMMTIPSQVTYMTAYDYFRTLFLSFDNESPVRTQTYSASTVTSISTSNSTTIPTPLSPSFSSVSAHTVLSTLLAGGIARALSATLVTPLELLRTRLQSSSSSSPSSFNTSRTKGGAFFTLFQEVRSSPDGIKILYRGLAPTLWRDVPFSAIYFAGYEFIKRSLTGNGLGETSSSSFNSTSTSSFLFGSKNLVKGNGNGKGNETLEEFSVAFISGAISGSIAALLTHPADVIKTRLQSQQTFTNLDSLSKSQKNYIQIQRRKALPLLKDLIKNEGFKGAFSGLSPRIAKIAPACGIMIGSFEVVGRALGGNEVGNQEDFDKDVWIEGEELGAR